MDHDGMQVDGDDGSSSGDDDGDDDDGMDMADNASAQAAAMQAAEPRSRPEPVVDEDGFEMVQKKGRGGRR